MYKACVDLGMGRWDKALRRAKRLPSSPDCQYLRGHLAIREGQFDLAMRDFYNATLIDFDHGLYFEALESEPVFNYALSSGGFVTLASGWLGCVAGLIVAYEYAGQKDRARQTAEDYFEEDQIILLLLVDQILGREDISEDAAREVISKTSSLTLTETGCFLSYWRARSMRRIGMYDVAKETIVKAIRKAKTPNVLLELRYERGKILERLDHKKQALVDWQWCFCQQPDFRDVSERVKKGEK